MNLTAAIINGIKEIRRRLKRRREMVSRIFILNN
jgi:hypothetical protein